MTLSSKITTYSPGTRDVESSASSGAGERWREKEEVGDECLFDLPNEVAQAQTASAATNSRIFMTKREGTCKGEYWASLHTRSSDSGPRCGVYFVYVRTRDPHDVKKGGARFS